MQNRTAKAFIHCHSDHSLKDSPLKIKDMVKTAKEMQAEAITLTDHGTATGWVEFMNACKEAGIKGIPGVEAYMESEYVNRAHLVLIAKNYKGFQELSCAITESNNHLQNVGGMMAPIMNKEILTRNFGNGNVIATTACVSGIISTILLGSEETMKKIDKLRKQMAKWNNPNSEEYLTAKEENKRLTECLETLVSKRNILDALSKKSYAKRQKGLESLKKTIRSEDEQKTYDEAYQMLSNEMEESRKAKEKLPGVKKQIANIKAKLTTSNQKCKKMEETHERYISTEEEINKLLEALPDKNEVYQKAERELLWYKELFGDDFYAEVQYHGLEAEKEIMPIIAELAVKHNIPLIATNDVHIATKEQAEARAFMKALRFEKWEAPSEEDKELYMKSDDELLDAISKILSKEIAEKAVENVKALCDKCEVLIPDTEHYPKYKDENGNEVEDSAKLLREFVYSQIPKKYPNGFDAYERLEYELDTIISLGYADYTLIVSDFIRFAKNYGINNHPAHVAMPVGPGRGSGAGSVANFLSDITNIDPLRYGLKFERYLNKDRVSMPDIDTDFSEEVREATIAYVTEKYGADTVASIRTCMTQGVRAAIANSARIRGYEKYPAKDSITKEELKSLRKPFQSMGENIKKEVPEQPGIKFKDCIAALKANNTSEDAKTIIQRAEMVEGTTTSLSVHAAGIIIGDGNPLKKYVPLFYNTAKGCWAVQCDMVEAEQMKLLKMDFLGLINLDIITECARRVKANTGITIDFDNLPFESEVFAEIYSKGKTSNVFQFESGGMKQMLREFQPETIEDIILLVAAYRPGPMDFIPSIIDVKHGRQKPHYVVPQLEQILTPTYGQPVYQEQLMDIFHLCAGFSLGEADIIRRYMSKKKVDKFLSYKPQFVSGLMQSGATKEEAETTWDSLTGFAEYAFNKSHAAAYAIVSYYTAWLKYHYPVEFMCATLNHTDIKKIPAVLYECKQMDIKVLPPDINKSMQEFEDRNGAILYGLGMIKGIKKEAESIINERALNGRYTSLKNFILRMPEIGKNTEKLIECGAFDSLQEGTRKSLLKIRETLSDLVGGMNDKIKQIANLQSEYENASTEEKKSIKKKIDNAALSLESKRAQYTEIEVNENLIDDNSQKLAREYELMGAYISGHPLDSYKNLYADSSVLLIADFIPGNHTHAGLISDLRIVNRKSDGKPMAFFKLEDMTGCIEVACFTDAYEEYSKLLVEGNVVRVFGNAIEEPSLNEDEEPKRKIVAKTIRSCRAEKIPYMVSVSNIASFESEKEILNEFLSKEGHSVYLHNRENGSIKAIPMYLKPDILEKEFENFVIIPLKKH